MNQPHLTPELSLLEGQLRRFLVTHIAPNYDRWERAGTMPRELWRQFGARGFLGADVAEMFGGAEAGYAAAACIIQTISAPAVPVWPPP